MPDEITKTFYAPVIKTGSHYIAILSDTSVDRDEEIIGKAFLESGARSEWLPALMDHENKALGLVNEWVNKRVIEKDGHYALSAEPKWFLSNPSAQILKGMLDDGAKMGISITAIPKGADEVEIKGQRFKRFTDGEMLSADWVGIPANKHAQAVALMKSFNFEVNDMDDKQFEELSKSVSAHGELLNSVAKAEVVAALEKKVNELSEAVVAMQKATMEAVAARDSTPVEKRERDLAELRKTPTADHGVADDNDISIGGLIKAMNPQKR